MQRNAPNSPKQSPQLALNDASRCCPEQAVALSHCALAAKNDLVLGLLLAGPAAVRALSGVYSGSRTFLGVALSAELTFTGPESVDVLIGGAAQVNCTYSPPPSKPRISQDCCS